MEFEPAVIYEAFHLFFTFLLSVCLCVGVCQCLQLHPVPKSSVPFVIMVMKCVCYRKMWTQSNYWLCRLALLWLRSRGCMIALPWNSSSPDRNTWKDIRKIVYGDFSCCLTAVGEHRPPQISHNPIKAKRFPFLYIHTPQACWIPCVLDSPYIQQLQHRERANPSRYKPNLHHQPLQMQR